MWQLSAPRKHKKAANHNVMASTKQWSAEKNFTKSQFFFSLPLDDEMNDPI
ncbi:conserved hypothetical protein [Xenorhabdus nematophila F1]|uniref:Uncharacterized protein n=1 Tax=Xenorhabdus nematophila (strain ATCC 19061 / DSM 3370 / CCUG 14189 / LMG 1036 / NCIMB 9965 / AN6) TaxID=406817 RepID=D3VJM2_XENNA|nr:hypothetical protein XNC1_0707 [Xenorhabdus nematophila ATCC 19061]CCW30860.1 conserved hypothetical protein [Xenorhabdus nematophila F1]CEE92218.1 hypothetical protein XNA1_270007 [Xenorhabdus nematophila str. Anatoliense]CEF33687.1 hypothetical protein XNW1_4880020 [Xenorhabdus nematophila str. Websteri]CEK21694.1 hypothetical protein XNC2_0698 [Xenorhabdus nematophila AN6/1]